MIICRVVKPQSLKTDVGAYKVREVYLVAVMCLAKYRGLEEHTVYTTM